MSVFRMKLSSTNCRSLLLVEPQMYAFCSALATCSSAYTLSEKTMILSPRSSWYLMRNWHAWNLLGFMQYSNMRLRDCSRRYSR